jgi:hypothetical protein
MHGSPDAPWYKSRIGKLVIVAPLCTIVFATIAAWYVTSRQQRCDRLAAFAVEKMGWSMERFAVECVDSNCSKLHDQLTDEHVKYFIGPYYGHRGFGSSERQCRVLLTLEGKGLRGCAWYGSRPGNRNDERYVFRISVPSGKQLDTVVAGCRGKEYGYPGELLYTESMIDETTCSFREPRGNPLLTQEEAVSRREKP